jgi:hypothetical protein
MYLNIRYIFKYSEEYIYYYICVYKQRKGKKEN